MDSRESLVSPPSLQQQLHHHQQQPHHHHQPPPAPGMNMMMPPNSYTTHHQHQNQHLPNNKNANLLSPNSIQQRFPFNSSSDQFGDGSSPSSGFRSGGYGIEPARKKRGRPRKYSPSQDGGNIALGLAPAPVNAVSGGNLESSYDGSGGTPNTDSSAKKHRGRPAGSGKKQLDALGSAGVGFTPHVIIVKAGERWADGNGAMDMISSQSLSPAGNRDIASTLEAFSQQGPRTVCILSANGSICNVTLRQPATSGGTVTYEGRFEIISLSGSFVHEESSNGNRSKPSGLSVSLAGSDGRVLGGGVAGMLVAASPVQVIIGSFIADGGKKLKSSVGGSSPVGAQPPNMLSFGGAVPGISPPSEGPSSESSDESGSSLLHHRTPPSGSYNINNNNNNNNDSQHQNQNQNQQHQQQQQQQPMQNLPMYSNMGWPSSTMNMLPN